MPEGAEAGIISGMYRLRAGGDGKVRVQLLGSGTILREVLAAAELLRGAIRHCRPTSGASRASASCAARRSTSSAGTRASRSAEPRESYVSECFGGSAGTVRRRHRLHEDRGRPDPPVGAGPLRRARHRRLRPQRRPRRAAPILRGRPQVHRASPRSRRSPDEGGIDRRPWSRRSPSSASIPTSRIRVTPSRRTSPASGSRRSRHR